MGGEGITPAEVQLGRRLPLNVEAGLAPWSAMEGNRSPSEYATHIIGGAREGHTGVGG